MKLSIDIGVGGRFHADYMASALRNAGHAVTLFTSFPRGRFPKLPPESIDSFLWPEVVFRALKRVGLENPGDLYKMQAFGRRWARAATREERKVDLCIGWSSFAKEAFEAGYASKKVVVRDSAHILFQTETLEREFRRLGLTYPDRLLCIERELSEYQMADRILVPSEFARKTFVDRGFSRDQIDVLRLGVNVALFKPGKLIEPKLPLQVVYFGTLSVQKGVHLLLEATQGFSPSVLSVELVGPVSPEFSPLLARYPQVRYRRGMDHTRLAEFLRSKDIFVLPTLHDGFGQVVIQAMASGILPMVSSHCGAAEVIRHGENGYIFPSGDSRAISQLLIDLSDDLPRVKRMRESACRISRDLSWQAYDRCLVEWVDSLFQTREVTRA